mmetsp:Transcript_107326/g.308849  ORF Transcript_107326/g.308849 Transcript_107326/m.308849 type:complete len:840 (-) Transcript_107326:128-2647(-)
MSKPANGVQNVMVCRGWGADEPGIAEAFMQVVADNQCQILDIAQFVMEGTLMFTFVLDVPDEISMGLMKELTKSAKQCNLQLDFYFPDAGQVRASIAGNENVAVLSIVSRAEISLQLLEGVDTLLSEHNCVVREVEHRSDNKKEVNGEVNKIEFRINCPAGLKLSELCVDGLQRLVSQFRAEMSLRWWSAMNRPNGKSLVVFGLSSQELVTCDILDEVLKEVGRDPKAAAPSDTKEKQNEAKAALLKGAGAQAVDKVIDRLQFTPGVRLLCSALKRLGCRLAILTSLGIKKVAEHVKRELDMDYVMTRDLEVVDNKFTGNYTGEMTEVRFRKTDLLTLIADREGIDYRNVILIGEEMTKMSARQAREVVDSFGPSVYFAPATCKDMSVALYLLGFNGSDVRALRKRRREEVSDVLVAPPGKRFQVQVSAKRRETGQLRRVLAPLRKLGDEVHFSTMSLCSLQDGGMAMGLDLRLQKQEPDSVMKELLFACQQQGLQVLSSSSQPPESAKGASNGASSLAGFKRRYVITIVQQPCLTAANLAKIFGLFRKSNINIWRIERLNLHAPAALQFTVTLPDSVELEAMSKQLVDASKAMGIDIAFQKDDLERWMRRMVVFDMDSTLIQQEVIDELAKYAGVEQEVKTITEAAMRGEMNFFESLKARVGLLKGHNAEELFKRVKANLVFTPGAKKLCDTLRRLGFKMAVISGGFLPVAREVQRYLGLDYAFANSLEVDENGNLTGSTSGPVVTPQRKRALLATIADVEGCELQQTIAVGDGANDIPMLQAAGLGIAFCAKPKVQDMSEFRINNKDLSTVLFLIGVSEHAVAHLGIEDEGQAAKIA